MVRALSNPVHLISPERGVDGRTVLAKARAPLVTDGRIGDFWIDTVAKKLYGPKNAAEWPDNGLIKGDGGWSPVFGIVTDGNRRVQRVVDWVGGEGTKPAAGQYVGATGLVDDIADAVDIRGVQGPEMLVSGLAAGADSISYETLVPHAETGDDNLQNPLKYFFSAGGLLTFKTVADAQAANVPARVSHVHILEIATIRVRVESEPGSGGSHRSADRFLPNEEGTDSANGGWWGDDLTVVTALVGLLGLAAGIIPTSAGSPGSPRIWLNGGIFQFS